ncbi:MAG: hypothetical protein JWO71_3385 [Candidatus Acidoferrum typicum]|nr:hypothetical protein [Candidatus Acidoferrum typicum]
MTVHTLQPKTSKTLLDYQRLRTPLDAKHQRDFGDKQLLMCYGVDCFFNCSISRSSIWRIRS